MIVWYQSQPSSHCSNCDDGAEGHEKAAVASAADNDTNADNNTERT